VTFLADTLAGCAIAFAIFYGSWRVAVQHADVGAFASFLGALLLAYEPAKRISRFPVDIQNGLVGARLIY
jgi:subfamily B ATP-binding cassette protein MsbA